MRPAADAARPSSFISRAGKHAGLVYDVAHLMGEHAALAVETTQDELFMPNLQAAWKGAVPAHNGP